VYRRITAFQTSPDLPGIASDAFLHENPGHQVDAVLRRSTR